jgi:hypothetical protein
MSHSGNTAMVYAEGNRHPQSLDILVRSLASN